MITTKVLIQVNDTLTRIKNQKGIKILWAIESGSRAWDMHSPNSDYDVRFVFTHPRSEYLKLNHPEDNYVFSPDNPLLDNLNIDGDFAGWDIFKFFSLLEKSNGTAIEWLQSGIAYLDWYSAFLSPSNTYSKILNYIERGFNQKALFYHYLALAKNNFYKYCQDKELVRTKKYLYVARPLLACHYLLNQKDKAEQTLPPVSIERLLKMVPVEEHIYGTMTDLVARKRVGFEASEEPGIPELDLWAKTELESLSVLGVDLPVRKVETYWMDEIIRDELEKYPGTS